MDNIETAAVPQLLSFFDLGRPLKILPIKEGISNHNYLVHTEQGEFVVKFPVGQTPQSIKNDIAIQHQLLQTGLPTPQYCCTKSGEHLFLAGDLKAVVSPRADGVVPQKMNAKLAFAFGSVLAQFHTAVTTLPFPNTNGLMNPQQSGIQSTIFAQGLPRGIIHGDFHQGNALVNSAQNEIIAMLDFEEAAENVWLVDLAVTIMAVCVSTDEHALDFDFVQETIRGYQSGRKLSKAEIAWLPEAINYAAKTWIRWFKANQLHRYAQKHQSRLDSLPACW